LSHHGVDVELIDKDADRLERLDRPIAVRGHRLGPATKLRAVAWDHATEGADVLLVCVPVEQLGDALSRAVTITAGGAVVVFSGGLDALEEIDVWPGERIHAVTNLEVRLNDDGEPEAGFHNFTWLGNAEGTESDVMRALQHDLAWIGPTLTTKVVVGMRWSKLVYELEAALPVLAGVPPHEFFGDPAAMSVAIELVREALTVAGDAGASPVAFDFFDPHLYPTTTDGERHTLEAWIRHAWQRHEQYRVGAPEGFTEPAGLAWSLDPRNPSAELPSLVDQLRRHAEPRARPTPLLDRLAALARGGATIERDSLVSEFASEAAS
jgi:ketopantoate reductase